MSPTQPAPVADPGQRSVPANTPRPAGSRSRRLTRAWPVLLAGVALTVLVGGYVRESLARNAGHVAYPLDDVYLHMAVARNLVEHGVWGMTRYGFTSAISSPLWTSLLAAVYALTGVHEATLVWMGLLTGFALLLAVDRVTSSVAPAGVAGIPSRVPGWARLPVLAFVVWFMPLGAMVASGMEHILHALLTLGFLALAGRMLARPRPNPLSRANVGTLALLGAGVTMSRFEGLFAVALVAGLLGLRRRWAAGFTVGLVGVAPVVGFGLLSMSKGWYFLPNSVLLKGNSPPLNSLPLLLEYLRHWWIVLLETPHLLALVWPALVLLTVRLVRQRTLWTEGTILLASFLALTVLHLQFARTGWFFRYEAYLVCLGLVAIGRAVIEGFTDPASRPSRGLRGLPWGELAGGILAIALAGRLQERAWVAHQLTPLSSNDVYEQQYQMGRFLRECCPPGTGVAANDIGAINFLADIRCLDLYGLASMEVARAKRAANYNPLTIGRLSRAAGVRVAVVYDHWFTEFGGLPLEWTRLGQWTIPHNHILGGATVSFYATEPAEVPTLLSALQRFNSALPEDVSVRLFPTGDTLPGIKVVAAYPKEGAAWGEWWWTDAEAVLGFPPPPDGGERTAVSFVVMSTPGLELEMFANDELVGTHRFPPESVGNWTPLTVPVRLRPGMNTVRLVGHGTPLQPPGDARRLLFAVGTPGYAPAR